MCKSNSSNPTASGTTASGSELPLAIGNVWVYDDYITDAVSVKIPGSDETEKDTIVGIDTIGGRAAYVLQSYINDTAAPVRYISFDQNANPQYFIDTTFGENSGMWNTIAEFSNTNAGTTVNFFNIVTGEETSDSVFTLLQNTDTVSETFNGVTSITDSAGTFNTKEYLDSSGASPTDVNITGKFILKQYYAPGIGKVKSSCTMTVGGATSGMIKQLVSFSVQ